MRNGHVTAALPETKVVILSVSRNDADLFDAIAAGASGYLLDVPDRQAAVEVVRRRSPNGVHEI